MPDDKALFLSDIFPTGYMGAEMWDLKRGDVVAVWGAGPVGLFAMASARLLGAERIIAIDRFDYRLAMAREVPDGLADEPVADASSRSPTAASGRRRRSHEGTPMARATPAGAAVAIIPSPMLNQPSPRASHSLRLGPRWRTPSPHSLPCPLSPYRVSLLRAPRLPRSRRWFQAGCHAAAGDRI